jgi:outer membrane protein assembly factor BamB
MKLPKQLQVWLSQRGALVLFLTTIVLLLIFQIWHERPQPSISHTLGTSTYPIDILWSKQETFRQTAGNGGKVVYLMPLGQDKIIALNIKSSTVVWKEELPFERSGARGMLADRNTIFTVDSTRADAYEATTGKLKWSTILGDGHVSVIPQLDSNILRIYLGEELIELDTETGKKLTVVPKGATIWISGNIVLQSSSTNQLKAIDKRTGKLLWTNDRLLYIDEGQEPIDIGNNNLLVGFTKGVCALNLQSGKYDWCHPEIYISDIAIDYQSQLGYAMRNDLVLLTIDLHTGDVLAETNFLSSQPINEQTGSMSSITFSDGILVVSFSDSGQTFGLSLK